MSEPDRRPVWAFRRRPRAAARPAMTQPTTPRPTTPRPTTPRPTTPRPTTPRPTTPRPTTALGAAALALALALPLAGCSARGPAPIALGQDVGDHCGMVIADPRFAAQMQTRRGRVYKFDAIECMVAFLQDGPVGAAQVRAAWVSDFASPGSWLRADEALYLRSPALRSPMGGNLAAFASRARLEEIKAQAPGLELAYQDLPNVVRELGLVHGDDDAPGDGAMGAPDGTPMPGMPGMAGDAGMNGGSGMAPGAGDGTAEPTEDAPE